MKKRIINALRFIWQSLKVPFAWQTLVLGGAYLAIELLRAMPSEALMDIINAQINATPELLQPVLKPIIYGMALLQYADTPILLAFQYIIIFCLSMFLCGFYLQLAHNTAKEVIPFLPAIRPVHFFLNGIKYLLFCACAGIVLCVFMVVIPLLLIPLFQDNTEWTANVAFTFTLLTIVYLISTGYRFIITLKWYEPFKFKTSIKSFGKAIIVTVKIVIATVLCCAIMAIPVALIMIAGDKLVEEIDRISSGNFVWVPICIALFIASCIKAYIMTATIFIVGSSCKNFISHESDNKDLATLSDNQIRDTEKSVTIKEIKSGTKAKKGKK